MQTVPLVAMVATQTIVYNLLCCRPRLVRTTRKFIENMTPELSLSGLEPQFLFIHKNIEAANVLAARLSNQVTS